MRISKKIGLFQSVISRSDYKRALTTTSSSSTVEIVQPEQQQRNDNSIIIAETNQTTTREIVVKSPSPQLLVPATSNNTSFQHMTFTGSTIVNFSTGTINHNTASRNEVVKNKQPETEEENVSKRTREY